MFGFGRRAKVRVISMPITGYGVRAPQTIPLWQQSRQFLAPGTPVHVYESAWHRAWHLPRFPYTLTDIRVKLESDFGTMLWVTAITPAGNTLGGGFGVLVERASGWQVVPVVLDPPPDPEPDPGEPMAA